MDRHEQKVRRDPQGLRQNNGEIEAMPVTPDEKRRLLKEWLRSRLAELE
jgi:hypothetical protein